VAQDEDEATPVSRETESADAEPTEIEADAAESTEPEATVEPSGEVAAKAEEEQEPDAAEAAELEAQAAPEEAEAEAPARPRRRRDATPAPTPATRRRRGRRQLRDVEVRAQAKYVRSSARKARLVCDHIRGKSVEEARAILAHTPRAIARDWSKLLESAVANAEHNHELIGEDLYVEAVRADEGPTIKRYRPRALGRATRIRKRTSHLTILLKPKP
jgi:ribosomal protein L22